MAAPALSDAIPPSDWRPRLVALDIDGTLCSGHGVSPILAHTTMSPAVRAAVGAVLRSDTHVVLSTGRSTIATLPFLAELGLSVGTAICSNGAVSIDAATGAVLDQSVFDLVEPVAVLRKVLPGAVFTVEEVGVGERTTVHLPGLEDFGGTLRVVDLDELVSTPSTRLTVHWPDRSRVELAAALAGVQVPGAHCVYEVDGAWMDISPIGVTKGSALEALRVRLGVSADDTLAVGDGTNDLEMLAWAAYGVAMGQAPEVVRAVADEVCPPVTEDGLATLLSRWF
ncbi:HAD family hydrolase [Nocardia sp. GCM10030253]|uniref:HAD family hydrolase n=1 Tax=Nocardia sp. GCM10030253 TaxID=3273404 RepID=UPI00362F4E28